LERLFHDGAFYQLWVVISRVLVVHRGLVVLFRQDLLRRAWLLLLLRPVVKVLCVPAGCPGS
jgi:hypothetical protein